MTVYFLTKTFHLLFVIAWMACVFYLPRILVNLAETQGQGPVQQRLYLMGRRLLRFGHAMFGLAFAFGLPLWLGFRFKPDWWPAMALGGWMHVKLTLVALLLAYFIVIGRWLKQAEAGVSALPSSTRLRWFNELPLLALVPILYLVLAKPF